MITDYLSQASNDAACISTNVALATPWKDLWNGKLELADEIIAEDFVAHAAPITGAGSDEIHGREALKQWVSGIHSILGDLKFHIQVGPIADVDHFVVRWSASGTYQGGFLGASSKSIGKTVSFTGTDTLRTADGKLAEYWANADSLLFVQELGVAEVPPR